MKETIKPGVAAGNDLQAIFADARNNGYALPAVNVTGTDTVNAVMEAAMIVKSPVILQFSNGGAQFYAGKGLPNDKYEASIIGAIAGAYHIHKVSEYYGVPVIIHTDHAAKKLLP